MFSYAINKLDGSEVKVSERYDKYYDAVLDSMLEADVLEKKVYIIIFKMARPMKCFYYQGVRV